MIRRKLEIALLVTLAAVLVGVISQRDSGAQEKAKENPVAEDKDKRLWTEDFAVMPGELGPTGRNPFFILEPGYYLVFKKGNVELTKLVLDETKKVGDVETRVVKETETKDGKIFEVALNFFAISKRTNSVYYFGEEVDFYENGKVVNHEGAWLHGAKGARFGLLMPGTPLIGGRHYQELAPKSAMDRAEILSMSETVETPAGTFKNCLKVEETTPLEPEVKELKYYAPGIGMIKDDKLELVKYGFQEKAKK